MGLVPMVRETGRKGAPTTSGSAYACVQAEEARAGAIFSCDSYEMIVDSAPLYVDLEQ